MNTPNTPKHIGRNTNKCPIIPPKRARSWCFTWNNHTTEDWHTCTALFNEMRIKKMVCQEEIGENGTPHIQGFVQFDNAINFTTLKKIDNKIHWEPCRNIPASINYCSKEKTRNGKIFKYGERDSREFDLKEYYAYMLEHCMDDHVYSGFKDITSGHKES
jgi:hypothetical protein